MLPNFKSLGSICILCCYKVIKQKEGIHDLIYNKIHEYINSGYTFDINADGLQTYYMSKGVQSNVVYGGVSMREGTTELVSLIERTVWSLVKYFPATKHDICRNAAKISNCNYAEAEEALANLVRRNIIITEEATNQDIARMLFMARFRVRSPKLSFKDRFLLMRNMQKKYGIHNKFFLLIKLHLIYPYFLSYKERQVLKACDNNTLDDYIFNKDRSIEDTNQRLINTTNCFYNLLMKTLINVY